MEPAAFLSILALHFIAAVSPGPSFVVCVRTAAAEGMRPALGLAVAFGLGAATWALGAVLGLALIFEIAPAALQAFKIAGGVFLLWIGWQTIRHAPDALPRGEALATPRSMASALRLGLATQMSNPKPAVFFGAVFAGLIPPGTPLPVIAALIFFVFVDETLWYVLVGRVFSLERARAAYGRAKLWTDRALGGMIAIFGIKIAAI